ncbi:MAG TPA: phosphate ABC transporter ATP-binding protein [Anaerolineae bacterium]|nr:phosphate ABC transporter ATP-binding protein [Anaerolineae bacterium]
MNDTVYRLEKVSKAYGSREVLRVDSLEIQQGEIFGIVGPSGAGKSTLLRLLDFLESPTSGHLHFKDCYSANGSRAPLDVRRRVTTVFQRPVLLNTSVYGNVAYGLKIRRDKEVQRKVKKVLEQVGLSDLTRERARFLSGGEAQRVALARAMVIEPEVLLLDEPTANLDPYNVGLIEEIVVDLNREQGTTIVLVTHNVFQAKRLAHRVALLLEGKVVEVAPVRDFFEAPQDPRTAAFVRGEMVY